MSRNGNSGNEGAAVWSLGKLSLRSGWFGFGAVLIATLAALAVTAPLIAPHVPSAQLDPVAGRHLPPLSTRISVVLTDGRRLLGESAAWQAETLIIRRQGREQVLPARVVDQPTQGEPADSLFFLLGTDRYSRDVLSRILWGARTSLTIGLVAGLLALTLGLTVGSLAGMAGGLVDSTLMRGVDALLMFPRLFLILTLAALFDATQWVVVAVLGATGWMAASRLVRAELMSLKQGDIALAARAVGQHPARTLIRHLLPAALPPVIVETSLRIGNIILAEAALSFLGFGVQPPTPSWGSMIADGADSLTSAWWVAAFPGLAIAVTVIAFNLLGDGLRDRLDPRRSDVEC